MCGDLRILFAHHAHGVLTSTIRQILNSFVRILNTRSAIGHSLQPTALRSTHVYEVRPCKDNRGFDLISDALTFGRALGMLGRMPWRMHLATRRITSGGT
jgi:hypothetical protein